MCRLENDSNNSASDSDSVEDEANIKKPNVVSDDGEREEEDIDSNTNEQKSNVRGNKTIRVTPVQLKKDESDGSGGNDGNDRNGEDGSDEEEYVNATDDGIWTNPSTSDILLSIINKSADVVVLMRSGSKKVETFALLKESQRDKILLYLKYPESGSKWRLWPSPEANKNENDTDDNDGWNPERSLKSNRPQLSMQRRRNLSTKLVVKRRVVRRVVSLH